MHSSLKIFRFVLSPALLLLAGPLAAQPLYLTNQHMDLSFHYDAAATGSNQLNLVLRYDAPASTIVSNDQFYIVGATAAKKTIPTNPNFAFLGPAGAPIWILPKAQDPLRPFLGISAEDSSLATFDSTMQLELVDVEGPGNFVVYDIPTTTPVLNMVFSNGVVSPTHYSIDALLNSHGHVNWAFSTNGLYRVTFRGVGSPTGSGTNLVGRDVTFAFQLLPLRPWETWVSTNWPPATRDDIAGPDMDPDGDTVLNAMEYALGMNPNAPSTVGLPVFSLLQTNGQTYGAMTYTRAKAATDVAIEVRATSSLSGPVWNTLTNLAGVVDLGDQEQVTLFDAVPVAGSAARFYQWQVNLNYP